MKPETTCPVCKLDPLPGDPDTCPQCDADLTCFKVLDALPEPGTAPSAPPSAPREIEPRLPGVRGHRPWLLAALLGGVAVILLGMLFYRVVSLERRLAVQRGALHDRLDGMENRLADILGRRDGLAETRAGLQSRLAKISESQGRLIESLAAIENRLDAIRESRNEATAAISTPARAAPRDPIQGRDPAAEMEGERPSRAERPRPPGSPPGEERSPPGLVGTTEREPAAPPPPLFEYHQASEKDTLWRIAERFYGSGVYYPVLLEHNPDLKIYSIGKKDRVAILKNVDRVKEIYKDITEIDGDRLYWFYTVRPGDSIQSITSRCCPRRRCIDDAAGADPAPTLRPGEKIRIQLSGAVK
ncbi:MAG: LysM peptidoglycan-binding domain-containing protein [Desulfobacterales bacterium]|nr:LysM peptidoglycan-binding domain-containing protein [Desulfobacterales bacterium]